MSSVRPYSESSRISRQLGTARELALSGAGPLARNLCASVFVNHMMLLSRDEELRRGFVECLLLLEMTGLIGRLLRAVYGTELVVTPIASPAAQRLVLLGFGHGMTLAMPYLGPDAAREDRAENAAQWSRAILQAAASADQQLSMDAAALPIAVTQAARARVDELLEPN